MTLPNRIGADTTQLKYSAVTLYADADRMNEDSFGRWLDWHANLGTPENRIHPKYVLLFTAARYNEGIRLLDAIKARLPHTTPIWRGYPDKVWNDAEFYDKCQRDGLTPTQAAEKWFNYRVRDHIADIRRIDAIIMLLNEAAPLFNVEFETECIRLLGEHGIRAAAAAWSVGNPADWADYSHPKMLAFYRMCVKYNTLLIPHEGGGRTPPLYNSMIGRFTSIKKELAKIAGGDKLDFYIGEFAMAHAWLTLNPDGSTKINVSSTRGWQDAALKVPDAEYVQYIKSSWAGGADWHYGKHNISLNVFCWPAVDGYDYKTFGVEHAPDFLKLLAAEIANGLSFEDETAPAPEQSPPPVVIAPAYTPEPLKVMERYCLRTPGGLLKKIYKSAVSWSDEAGKVADGAIVTFIDQQFAYGDWWRRISYQDKQATYIGWIPLEGGMVKFNALTTESPVVKPDKPVEPPESPPDAITGLTRDELKALIREVFKEWLLEVAAVA